MRELAVEPRATNYMFLFYCDKMGTAFLAVEIAEVDTHPPKEEEKKKKKKGGGAYSGLPTWVLR